MDSASSSAQNTDLGAATLRHGPYRMATRHRQTTHTISKGQLEPDLCIIQAKTLTLSSNLSPSSLNHLYYSSESLFTLHTFVEEKNVGYDQFD